VGGAASAAVGDLSHLANGLFGAVGERTAFEVGPQALAGVEVGRVTRQAFDLEPLLAAHEGGHLMAPVAGETVPDQDDRRPQAPVQVTQGRDQDVAAVAAWLGVQVEACPSAIGAVAEEAGS